MGKKSGKKKIVLSLSEFTQDDKAGKAPEIAALPSAPKQAEEWDAEGGRPGYNSRGFKERTTTKRYDDARVDDDEFMQRSWDRTGPMDDEGGSGAGRGQMDRDWDGVRRGPLDPEGAGEAERDWDGMRRGPIDGPTDSDPIERDWESMRRQVVEAFDSGAGEKDVDFSSVRRAPVEAENAREVSNIDFSTRRGPVEAEFDNAGREIDFLSRRGPMEEDIVRKDCERDFSDVRRGTAAIEAFNESNEEKVDFENVRFKQSAIEALPAKGAEAERDFGDVRRVQGPIATAELPRQKYSDSSSDVNWNIRKGPVDAIPHRAAENMRAGRPNDVEFDRNATPRKEKQQTDTESTITTSSANQTDSVTISRDDSSRHSDRRVKQASAIAQGREIDWGRARNESKTIATSRSSEHSNIDGEGTPGRVDVLSRNFKNEEMSDSFENAKTGNEDIAKDDEAGSWTTVRNLSSVRRTGSRGGYTTRGKPVPSRPNGSGSRERGPRERSTARLVPLSSRDSAAVARTE